MTVTERKDKIKTVNDYLAGLEVVLTELNDVRFPSAGMLTAIGHIRKAQVELNKELDKIKQTKQ